jgi:cytochrome c-type biogenesis protein CcmH/NrfG
LFAVKTRIHQQFTVVAMLERRYDDLEVLVSTDDDADSVATTQRAGTSGHNAAPASAVAATTTTTTTLTVTNRKDDTLVKGARAVVMVVLVVSAAVVASLAYVLLSRHEYNAFQDQVRHRKTTKPLGARTPKAVAARLVVSPTFVCTHTHDAQPVTVSQQCQSSHEHGQKEHRQCLCQY